MDENLPEAPHILIVEARFYPAIADEMAKGAEAWLSARGCTFERVSVPGAFEIPGAIGFAADGGKFDGYVALGCVIRGETTHYDYVCIESARGLQDLALNRRLAIGYGILTVENDRQAWARASVEQGDKGGKAAEACYEMLQLRHKFGSSAR